MGGEVQLQISHLQLFLTDHVVIRFAGIRGSRCSVSLRKVLRASTVTAAAMLLMISTLFLAGCGGGYSNSNTVAVTITPTTATLSASQTTSFAASVTNTSNTAVT